MYIDPKRMDIYSRTHQQKLMARCAIGVYLTMPKFILEINLGNEGMRSPVHIRDALRAISDKIRYDDELDDLTQNIRDINGNVVGKYEVI